jgi:hypothetical protein
MARKAQSEVKNQIITDELIKAIIKVPNYKDSPELYVKMLKSSSYIANKYKFLLDKINNATPLADFYFASSDFLRNSTRFGNDFKIVCTLKGSPIDADIENHKVFDYNLTYDKIYNYALLNRKHIVYILTCIHNGVEKILKIGMSDNSFKTRNYVNRRFDKCEKHPVDASTEFPFAILACSGIAINVYIMPIACEDIIDKYYDEEIVKTVYANINTYTAREAEMFLTKKYKHQYNHLPIGCFQN